MAASQLAYTAQDQFHCVVSGRADVIVIEPKFKEVFEMQEEPFNHSGSGRAAVDTEMVNMFQYKTIQDVPWKWGTIWEKDCIFIPAGHLQKIRAFGQYFGIAFSFQKLEKYDDCTNDDISSEKILDKTEAFVTSDGDHVTYGVTPWTEGTLKNALRFIMHDKERLYKEEWIHFCMNRAQSEGLWLADPAAFAWQIYKDIFDPQLRGYVERNELEKIMDGRLGEVAMIFNSGDNVLKVKKTARDEL